PLTAANALLPKSRSLDDGYQRSKNANNVESAMDQSSYVEHSGMDDSNLGQDGGYDDLSVVDGVKIEGVHGSYMEDQVDDDDEEPVDLYYEDDQSNAEQYDTEDSYNSQSGTGGNKTPPTQFERPHVPLRKLLPKVKMSRQHNNNNNNNATRQFVGVGHSLSLYRQQQPIKNFTSRNSYLFLLIISKCLTIFN
ncbi:hypothetical protein Ocin01_07007, partial [Orchesella cincta]